jgi:hypothetical protein
LHVTAFVTRNFLGAAALFLVAVAPLWSGRYLPAVDYPQHVFAGYALARVIEGDAEYREVYAERRDASAFTFHYVVAGATLLLGDAERATKLYLSIIVGMLIASSSMLCAACGRSRWLAVLAPCLLYGSDIFSWGLFPYLACIPAVLAGTAWLIRVLHDGDRFSAVGLAVATLFIGLGHVMAYIPFAVVGVALLVTIPSRFRSRAALGFAPAGVIFTIGIARTLLDGRSAGGLGALPALLYEDPHRATLWSALFGTFKPMIALATPLALLAAVGISLGIWAFTRRSTPAKSIAKGAMGAPLVMAVSLLAAYFALPYGIEGVVYLIAIRIPFVAAQFFLISLPLFERDMAGVRGRIARVGLAAALLISSSANTALVGDFSREAGRLEPIIAVIRAEGVSCPRIYNMDLVLSSRVAAHAQYLHIAEYVAARTHGIPSGSNVAASTVYPLAYRDAVPPSAGRTRPVQPTNEWTAWQVDYDALLAEYDYLLLTDTGLSAAGFAETYAGRLELAATSDSWFLFRIMRPRRAARFPRSDFAGAFRRLPFSRSRTDVAGVIALAVRGSYAPAKLIDVDLHERVAHVLDDNRGKPTLSRPFLPEATEGAG